ncbi:30S ribosomal protein S11 [Candidatus Parcubacteria bacterium]|nr:30S ribosomal protein S11 [Candidatus Parcubacteria bacterium]
MQTVVVKGKKKKKPAPFLRGGRGQAHIKSSYNNTVVSITDLNGAVLAWATAGKCGFKGPKKATPYAAGVIVKSLANKIKELDIKEVDVFVKGVGTGREAAIRALGASGLSVTSIKDVTPIPHGGCRPKKRRRV